MQVHRRALSPQRPTNRPKLARDLVIAALCEDAFGGLQPTLQRNIVEIFRGDAPMVQQIKRQ